MSKFMADCNVDVQSNASRATGVNLPLPPPATTNAVSFTLSFELDPLTLSRLARAFPLNLTVVQ